MLKYVLKRLILLIPVLIGITLLIYIVLDLSPSDPARIVLGNGEFTQAQLEEQRVVMGLDQPLLLRYVKYIGNAVRGDFGTSWLHGYSVSQEFVNRLPFTLQLGIYANILSIIIGIPFGIIAGVRHNKPSDFIITFISLLLASAPSFWFAMMGQLYISLQMGLLPVSGAETLAHFALPAIVLSGLLTAQNARVTRTWLVDVIRSDYVRTARAKGAKEFTVIVKHALRNAMLPVITTLGLHFAMIMGSSPVIETVFAMPGIGSFLINAVKSGDVPVVMGCVVVIALFVGVVNLAVDLIYALVDPRVKLG